MSTIQTIGLSALVYIIFILLLYHVKDQDNMSDVAFILYYVLGSVSSMMVIMGADKKEK